MNISLDCRECGMSIFERYAPRGLCLDCEANERRENCQDCGGTGGEYSHAPSCTSDFCNGSGDEHSCNGSWSWCSSCAPRYRVRPPSTPAAGPGGRSSDCA